MATGAHDPAQAHRHDPVYDRLAATTEFTALRSAYRRFAIPATIAFLSWYLLYVLMSMWATSFMSHVLFGNINVALVFGLLQFITTFFIAWLYSRHSAAELDPLARKLDEEYEQFKAEVTGPGTTGPRENGPDTTGTDTGTENTETGEEN